MSGGTGFISTALPLKPRERLPKLERADRPRTGVAVARCKAQVVDAKRPMWFTNFVELFFGKDEICIPQKDSNPENRVSDIEEGRRKYRWRHDSCGNASMIDGLPIPDELPRFGWIEELVGIILRAVRNSRAASSASGDDKGALEGISSTASTFLQSVTDGKISEDEIEGVMGELGGIMSESMPQGPGNYFKDYEDLYKVLDLDVVAKDNQFLTDEIFGWYRIGGANCMRLTKTADPLKLFPELTDETFRSIPCFENDSLSAAAADDRLYYVEYPEFDNLPDTKKGKFVYAPRALFAVPQAKTSIRQSLLPIAIRCKKDLPMYTPTSDMLAWYGAKTTVQVADMLTQSTIYHLGRCHLLIEVFNCATHRALAPTHPLYKLLMVHFYGTALMNWAATKTLIKDGGQIDVITAPDMESARQLAAGCINNPAMFSFNDWMPDVELRSRGVMSEKLCYPYRDDSLLVWNAIQNWVASYVTAYYASDAEVAGDKELQAWCREVSDPALGSVPGFGDDGKGGISSIDYLVRVVTMIIFTASAQHSATNFPQSSVMQYAPAMPFCGYAPPLKEKAPFKDMREFVTEMMPPLEAAAAQLMVTEVLGTLHYTKLGDYGSQLKFAPKSVQEALKVFKRDLEGIAVIVGNRNEEERNSDLPPFDYMHPKNIPQSINI